MNTTAVPPTVNPYPIRYHGGIAVCNEHFEGRDALCAKMILFSFLAFATAVACVVKCVRLYIGVTVEKYHLIVFSLAALECIVLCFHWAFVERTELHFVALFFLVDEFLVICAFYGGLALKVLNHRGFLEWVYYPLAIVIFFYFVGVLAYALIDLAPFAQECTRPQWLIFSVSQFVLAQLFLIAGVLLTGAMNAVSNIDVKYLASKKATLWSLIIVFEISSVVNFIYDIVLQLYPEDGECDTIFGPPDAAAFVIVTWSQLLICYLLPVWVMLYVLHPSTRATVIHMGPMNRSMHMDISTSEDDSYSSDQIQEPLARAYSRPPSSWSERDQYY
eukprot:m.52710 g.52710  ORF g.52710 m.52710 type:complete len:332 (+) comp6404_c0_seq1:77-1072(+)